jgi:hypothetical protein
MLAINSDFFIVHYDSSGNVLWAKSAGGGDWDVGHSISTDSFGNIFVTGFFGSSSITFGTTTLVNASGPPYYDIFVTSYDALGNVFWGKSAGGSNYDFGHGISTDSFGNVLVTGFFRSSSITFGTTTLTNSGSYPNIFTAKLASTVGIEENIFEGTVSVYPNPSSGIFNLLMNQFVKESIRISACNVLGEEVYHRQIDKSINCQIDLSTQPAGVYFVRVRSGEGEAVKKIVIQK